MTDDFERDLRRWLAETAPAPADDGFIDRLSRELAQRRQRHATWRGLVGAALFITALTATPYLATGVASLAGLVEHVAIPFANRAAAPAAWTMGGLVALWALLRTLVASTGRL